MGIRSSVGRLIVSLFFFFFSLLAVFRAPVYALWLPALMATEGGTYLALGGAVWVWRIKSLNVVDDVARGLAILAVFFFLTPLARALSLKQSLPAQFQNAFGTVVPRARGNAPSRATPLSFLDLFCGVRSPAVRERSIVYAESGGRPLRMTIYSPLERADVLPAVLVIHGGSWNGGERGQFSALNRYLAARGYLVVSIDYRLAPDALFPAPREDVFAAITALRARAVEFSWDQKNVVLLGRSAGGQIALSAAYAGREPAIRGVIAFYTPNDLVFGYEHPGNPRVLNSPAIIQNYLGVPLNKETRARYADASPLNFVGPATPPTLLIHGGRDELVWAIHDERLSQKLQEAHRPYFYLRLPWATHGCDALLNGPSGQLSLFVVERFLAVVMPSRKG